jgi:uncharacterized protein
MRAFRHIRIAVVALGAALVAALGPAVPAAAQTFPALTGRVVDHAHVLDRETRSALVGRLAALEAHNTDQVVVATVTSLEGLAIEEYATKLFRHWQLGQKDKNNGVLLLVAPAERKVRIEVGYGLEGTLTDAVAKLIITKSIVPHFRANDMSAGIVQGIDDIVSVLTGDSAAWQRRAAPPPAVVHSNGPQPLPAWAEPLVAGLVFLMFLVVGGLLSWFVLALFFTALVLAGVLPRVEDRHGIWLFLNHFNTDHVEDKHALAHGRRGRHRSSSSGSSSSSWSSSSSSDSSSSDSFSGGGGSSGGGGASGDW